MRIARPNRLIASNQKIGMQAGLCYQNAIKRIASSGKLGSFGNYVIERLGTKGKTHAQRHLRDHRVGRWIDSTNRVQILQPQPHYGRDSPFVLIQQHLHRIGKPLLIIGIKPNDDVYWAILPQLCAYFCLMKKATARRTLLTVTVQVAILPVQAPAHVTNLEPAPGVAVNVIFAPGATSILHCAPQLMPLG